MTKKSCELGFRESGMWKKSIRFICRYLAIGVLIGIGIYAIDEIHWRLFGSERVAVLQQSIDRLNKLQEELVIEPIVGHLEEENSDCLPSCERTAGPDPFRPTPYFVNGEIQGYRIYPGSDRHTFKSLGLRPGDLVTEIDGQPLTDSVVAFGLFEKALSGQAVQFSILRGDEPKKIEIKVD